MTGWSKLISGNLSCEWVTPTEVLSAGELSRIRREKRGYSTPHITWLINIWKARSLSSIEFVIACSAKIRIIRHNNKFALTKVFAWSLNKQSGKRILAVKICINSLDITHLRDTYRRISLSSGESSWVNRLNSDLWRNCYQSMVALMVSSWRAICARSDRCVRWQTLHPEMFIQCESFITANCPEKVQVSWGRIIGFYWVFVCIPNCAFKMRFGSFWSICGKSFGFAAAKTKKKTLCHSGYWLSPYWPA